MSDINKPIVSNLNTFSTDLTNLTYWTNNRCTSEKNIQDPYGRYNGITLIAKAENGSHGLARPTAYRPSLAAGITYTHSIFVKPAGMDKVFYSTNAVISGVTKQIGIDPVTGIIYGDTTTGLVTASATPVNFGWYRVIFTFTSVISSAADFGFLFTNTSSTSYVGDGINGMSFFGPQLTQTVTDVPYVQTTGFSIPAPELNAPTFAYRPDSGLSADGNMYFKASDGLILERQTPDLKVFATWFGVVADGVTDSADFLQKAIDYCTSSGKGIELVLPQGVIIVGKTIKFNNASTSFTMSGQGIPTTGNSGGTKILYTGTGGPDTKIFNIVGTVPFRYFSFNRFSIEAQYNDACEVGFNFESSQSSTFNFTEFMTYYCTYGIKLNVGSGANAEFMWFNRCRIKGTLYGFWQDAPQALSHKFTNCAVGCEQGGYPFYFSKEAGGTFLANDASASGPAVREPNTNAGQLGAYYVDNGLIYRVMQTGETGSATNLGGNTGKGIVDGGVIWDYVRAEAGSTLLYVGGGQVDALEYLGGRSEGVDGLVEFDAGANGLSVNITGLTISVPKKNRLAYIAKFNGAATGRVAINGITAYATGTGDAEISSGSKKWLIDLGTSNYAQVTAKDCHFFGVRPVVLGGLNNTTRANPVSSQSLKLNKVEIIDCTEDFLTGTAIKKFPLNKTYINSFATKTPLVIQQNLLLQSKYGEAEGSNITAPAPWLHTGNTQYFLLLSNMKDGSKNLINPYGKYFRLAASSGVSSIVNAAAASSSYANIYNYKALLTAYGAGTLYFALINSETNIVYDEITLKTLPNSSYIKEKVSISLRAILPVGETGYLKLIQKNISSSSSLDVEIHEQYIYQDNGSAFVPTSTEVISKTQAWSVLEPAIKASSRLQIPFKPDAYGSNIASFENEADIYISSDLLTEKIYTDRWEERPRQDIGASAPTTLSWPKGFKRWNSNFDGGSGSAVLYWECVVAGTPGTWFPVTPVMLVGSSDIEITDASKGVILTDSADGLRKRITIANGEIEIIAV